MKLSRFVPAAVVGLGLLAPSMEAQTYETIAFDYPAGNLGGLGGGIGWADVWWSGNNQDAGLIVTPGFDAVGGKMRVNISNEGSYRLIDLRGLDKITDQGAIGADGTEIWISQWTQRVAPGDDTYGHIILNWQWVMEGLCVGSPHPAIEWGMEQPWLSPPQFIPATSCDVLTQLVTKIEFLPGDELCSLWLDPATSHPTTTPDLQVWMQDFRFNEIGLKSGNGNAPAGYDFDAIEISTPNFRPQLTASNVVGGQTSTIDITNCDPGNNVIIGYSLAGGGPFTTQYGDAALTPPISQIGPFTADSLGEVQLMVPIPGPLAGQQIWAQCLELIPAGASGGVLGNAFTVTVG